MTKYHPQRNKLHSRPPPSSTRLWVVGDNDDDDAAAAAAVHLIVHGVDERCSCPTTNACGCQSVWAERLVQHPRVWFVTRFLVCTGEQSPSWIPSRHHCRYLQPARCPDTGGTNPQSVALEHRQGRQALDLTRDKPLPNIPASSTTRPCVAVASILAFTLALLADTLPPRSPSALSVLVLDRLIQRLCQIRTMGTSDSPKHLNSNPSTDIPQRRLSRSTPSPHHHVPSHPQQLQPNPIKSTSTQPTRRKRQPCEILQGKRLSKASNGPNRQVQTGARPQWHEHAESPTLLDHPKLTMVTAYSVPQVQNTFPLPHLHLHPHRLPTLQLFLHPVIQLLPLFNPLYPPSTSLIACEIHIPTRLPRPRSAMSFLRSMWRHNRTLPTNGPKIGPPLADPPARKSMSEMGHGPVTFAPFTPSASDSDLGHYDEYINFYHGELASNTEHALRLRYSRQLDDHDLAMTYALIFRPELGSWTWIPALVRQRGQIPS
jgi:hypothetical protein